MEVTTVKCDNCGKQAEKPRVGHLSMSDRPDGWFYLMGDLGRDFCCLGCVGEWAKATVAADSSHAAVAHAQGLNRVPSVGAKVL